jgi:predicted flap endonuclease-1-like 5' DNA nuclease
VRDDLLGAPGRERARRQEGVTARLRQDAHRVVDVVADLGVYFLETGAAAATTSSPSPSALDSSVRVVEGIGEKYAARLAEAGIHRCRQLLDSGATRQGREALAEKSGISAERLLTWINHIDLFRVEGIGAEYAGLLETAGVDSVPELAQRNPQNLHATLRAVNEKAGEVRRLPGVDRVADWIRQAQALPRVVTH